MKLMFVSDIHGSLYYAKQMQKLYAEEKADKLILLGDLLYHGPRNDLPTEYNPKGVIEILNSMKFDILAVRGNCEAEVDQMVLDFPVMADYMIMYLKNDTMAFITHGHIHNNQNPPMLKNGDLLIHGHTHIQAIDRTINGYTYINPGSISIPKADNKPSFMTYENGVFTIKDLDKNIIMTYSI